MKPIRLKAGTYYVGDPQYIFKQSWNKVVQTEGYYYCDEVTKIFGIDCFTASTYDGDGTFVDNDGRSYRIDSGMLSVIPVALLEVDGIYTIEQVNSKDFIHIIQFRNDFNVCVDDGMFLIDNITIDTYPERDDDNNYYNEGYYDDDESCYNTNYDPYIDEDYDNDGYD